MNALPAAQALDRYFLEARSKLLDIAAILDRIDRGGGLVDERLDRIREALSILQDEDPERAARIQQVFTLAYDPQWERPPRRGG